MALTLRYLASGNFLKTIAYDFGIGHSTAGEIVISVPIGLYKVLKRSYLKRPSTLTEWGSKAIEFYNRWDFPNSVGAIDGKHISIRCLHNSGIKRERFLYHLRIWFITSHRINLLQLKRVF